MGRTSHRQRSAFVLCVAVGLIGLAGFSLALHVLSRPGQGGASIVTSTCTGHTAGRLDHETRDVGTFASWGVDYIKADRCNASGLVMKDLFARWRDAIVASGRPILLSASDNTPSDEPWAWGPITAHQWRMSGDISDDWATMIRNFDLNAAHAAATGPGTSNGPDMR